MAKIIKEIKERSPRMVFIWGFGSVLRKWRIWWRNIRINKAMEDIPNIL
jgi:hypothetical protein